MNITDFTFRVIILFIPGFITFLVVDNLTTHRDTSTPRMLLYSLTLGFLDYFVYYPLTLVPALGLDFTLLEALGDGGPLIDIRQTMVLTAVALPVGLLISTAINKYWLHRLASRLGVSRKIGDSDVWSLVMNRQSEDWWVVVRSPDDDLMYEGWLNAFSDSTDALDEILLLDVKVYRNSSGELLYEIPAAYLNMERGKKIVEFPRYNPPAKLGSEKEAEP
jgi:hypothetical protein